MRTPSSIVSETSFAWARLGAARTMPTTLHASKRRRRTNAEGTRRYHRPVEPRPVGVFDSGVGGLTVLHECLVTMPHEDFVYLGDHARLPYGPRPLDEVRGFAGRSAASSSARA